jgi:putative FmdB family regulatory protein
MPIYEYRCGNCGFEKEYLQKLSDPAITDCPSCGHAQMRKLVSAAGFQLKGTGWYATDFKGNGKAPAAAKKDAGKGEAGASDSGGSGSGSADSGGSKAEASAPACGAGACPACQ